MRIVFVNGYHCLSSLFIRWILYTGLMHNASYRCIFRFRSHASHKSLSTCNLCWFDRISAIRFCFDDTRTIDVCVCVCIFRLENIGRHAISNSFVAFDTTRRTPSIEPLNKRRVFPSVGLGRLFVIPAFLRAFDVKVAPYTILTS